MPVSSPSVAVECVGDSVNGFRPPVRIWARERVGDEHKEFVETSLAVEHHHTLLRQPTDAQGDWWRRKNSIQTGTKTQMPSAAGILTKANNIEARAKIGPG